MACSSALPEGLAISVIMLETGLGGEEQRGAGPGASRMKTREATAHTVREIVRKLNGAAGKGKKSLSAV